MYSGPKSCVNINGNLTGWFPVGSGVRQGDTLSPIIFALFINDLAENVKKANLGVPISNTGDQMSILLYADDLVFVSPNWESAQKQLDILTCWCRRWGMVVNHTKSQVIHARNHQRPLCGRDLVLCERELLYVPSYKYLGCWIHKFSNHEKTVSVLTSAAGRSFGRIINIFKKFGDLGYETFTMLFDNYVLPVAGYAAGVWGFKDYPAPQVLQNKAERFFLGVHRFAPLPAPCIEMDWLPMRSIRWIEMLRLMNRLARMDEGRMAKKILRWDIALGCVGWMRDILDICEMWGIPSPVGPYMTVYQYDLEPIQRIALRGARERWVEAAHRMPKLRTYVQIRDFMDIGILVQANLPRGQRSTMAKMLCGILPLEIEVLSSEEDGRSRH